MLCGPVTIEVGQYDSMEKNAIVKFIVLFKGQFGSEKQYLDIIITFI